MRKFTNHTGNRQNGTTPKPLARKIAKVSPMPREQILRLQKNFATRSVGMRFKLISMAGLVLMGVLFFGSAASAQSFVYSGVPGPGTVIGWNFGHAANCQVQIAGSTVWYLFVAQENGSYGYTNNPGLAATVASACQTGNLLAIHVTSFSPYTWDYVIIYPFK